MKIIAISDTHIKAQDLLSDKLVKLYEADNNSVIIHAGDALKVGSLHEAYLFLDWFDSLPFKHKIYVPGNHDFCIDTAMKNNPEYEKLSLEVAHKEWSNVKILIDDIVEIDGVTIGGVCAIPDLANWAFYKNEVARKKLFNEFAPVYVLINHAPFEPYLEASHFKYYGCDYAKEYAIKQKVQAYICGHIHESHGYKNIDGVDCYNVAILDEHYKYKNEPTVITVE